MKISRAGAFISYGDYAVNLPAPAYSWNSKNAELVATDASKVKDFTTTAHHRYAVRISLSECLEIIEVLSVAAQANPAEFEHAFEPVLKPILKFSATVQGLHAVPITNGA